MKRNYNGNVNHSILRELEDLCNLNSENRKILMCEFIEKGELSFSVNTNPITGVPSEELKVCTLKSEEEITEFLKQDFEEKLTRYLNGKNIKDYLLIILIEFIKKSNGVFPNKDEMKQIQKEAEAKRIATLPSPSNSNKPKEITDTDIKLEILQLVEEIMESRRKSNKNDIFIPVEPYSERLGIQTDDFYGNIFHEKYYGYGNFRDYSCIIQMKKQSDFKSIKFFYNYSAVPVICIENFMEEEIHIPVTEILITIHKGIVEIAKKEGVEFESEIDYDKIFLKKQ